MKRTLIIISIILILSGLVIAFIAFASAGFRFKNIGNKKAVTQNFSVAESFNAIEIDDDCGHYDIKVVPSEYESTEIVMFGAKEIKLNYTVINSKLSIEIFDESSFFLRLFDFGPDAYMILSVPEKEYRSLKIETSSGDSTVSSLKIGSLDIECASGDVFLSDVTATSTEIDTSSGDIHIKDSDIGSAMLDATSGDVQLRSTDAKALNIELTSGEISLSRVSVLNETTINVTSGDIECENVIIQGTLKIETTSGDVELSDCDAAKINIETTSGDVEGRLLTPKTFDAKATSGEVNVPNTQSGNGECYIRTSSGDIEISIAR